MQPTLPNLGDQLPPNLYPYSPAYYPAGGAKRVAVTINANGAGSQNSFNVQGPALMSVNLGGGGAGEGETGGGGDFTYPDGHTAVIVEHSHMYACTCICVCVHTYTHGRMYVLHTYRWGARPRSLVCRIKRAGCLRLRGTMTPSRCQCLCMYVCIHAYIFVYVYACM